MKQQTRILIIDDNPVILDLLRGVLEPVASVQTCSNATDAFRRAEKQLPDLILTDYRMPGLSGLELLAKLRISFPRLAVIVLASRADINGPLAGSAPLVEEIIEKPFFVAEALPRIRRVLDRLALGKAAREAADSTSLRGTLTQMSVVDLMQTVDLGRKTCRLVLNRSGSQCEMDFHEGQLVHASFGGFTGEDAVYPVVTWTEGSFLIDFQRVECPHTVTQSTQAILLEALRRFDESQHEAESHSTQTTQ